MVFLLVSTGYMYTGFPYTKLIIKYILVCVYGVNFDYSVSIFLFIQVLSKFLSIVLTTYSRYIMIAKNLFLYFFRQVHTHLGPKYLTGLKIQFALCYNDFVDMWNWNFPIKSGLSNRFIYLSYNYYVLITYTTKHQSF